jgi:hypothetical protein
MKLQNAVWLQSESWVTSAGEGLFVYDFASLGDVVEIEVLDAKAIFQDCAVIFLSAEFHCKDVSVGYCGCDNQFWRI